MPGLSAKNSDRISASMGAIMEFVNIISDPDNPINYDLTAELEKIELFFNKSDPNNVVLNVVCSGRVNQKFVFNHGQNHD